MKRDKIFWLITATLFFGLLVPILVQNGMFLDGVTYSSISKNMANGLGSFWDPHYTQTLYSNFHEHPALFFIIQSFFFDLLGNGIHTERIFTFLTSILTAWGIVLCWNTFCKNNELKRYSWTVILLWITIPVVFWSYRHNMIENVLSIFTIFSVYFISRSLLEKRIPFLLIGGVLIIMAFLTKGPVGLFPLAVPFFYLLAFSQQKYWRTVLYGLLLLASTTSIYFLLIYMFPEIKQNIVSYFEQQLLPSLSNNREITVGSRFSILVKLLSELALPLLILISLLAGSWVKKRSVHFAFKRESLFFLLTALSASLPLIVTLKQRRYYLVPALAFFMLSAGFVIVPLIMRYIDGLSTRTLLWIKRVSFVLFSLVIVFSIFRFGKYSRDEAIIKDVHKIAAAIPEGTIFGTTKETWSDWALVAYMSRIGNLSLDCDHQCDYYLIDKSKETNQQLYDEYSVIDLKLEKYIILKRRRGQ